MRDTAADFSESDKLSRFDLIYLLPIALALGLTGLAAFLWSLTSSQCDDVDGATSVLANDYINQVRSRRERSVAQ